MECVTVIVMVIYDYHFSQLSECSLISTSELEKAKNTVTNVLVNCQLYMRKQKVRENVYIDIKNNNYYFL